jgi:hypothetical protein
LRYFITSLFQLELSWIRTSYSGSRSRVRGVHSFRCLSSRSYPLHDYTNAYLRTAPSTKSSTTQSRMSRPPRGARLR